MYRCVWRREKPAQTERSSCPQGRRHERNAPDAQPFEIQRNAGRVSDKEPQQSGNPEERPLPEPAANQCMTAATVERGDG